MYVLLLLKDKIERIRFRSDLKTWAGSEKSHFFLFEVFPSHVIE